MNIDVLQELNRVQRQLERAQSVGLPATLTGDEWTTILEQFQGLCAYCLTTPFKELDHIIPLSVGRGGTTALNCVPACKRCNGCPVWVFRGRSSVLH